MFDMKYKERTEVRADSAIYILHNKVNDDIAFILSNMSNMENIKHGILLASVQNEPIFGGRRLYRLINLLIYQYIL